MNIVADALAVRNYNPHTSWRAASKNVPPAIYEFRAHSVAAFKNPNCRRRLANLSDGQLRELIAALIRARANYAAVTDELLLALDEMRP
jgi:hypothetical protein